MKIVLTESQLRQLSELTWLEKVHEHIDEFRIPLTPKIYQILFGKYKIKSFHISDIPNIPNIQNMIGTKKTLSTFRFMDEDKIDEIRGVQTKGGIIYEIEGDLVLYSPTDIMSRPDENGVRWIDNYEIFYGSLSYDWIKIARDIIGPWRLRGTEKSEFTKNIKKYFIAAQEFVEKHKKEIIDNLSSLRGSSWDEILVNNIRINDIFWDNNRPRLIYDRIKYRSNNGFSLNDREKNILNNYESWVDKIQKRLESIARGKVYTFDNEISPIEFVISHGGYSQSEKYVIPPDVFQQE